MRPYVIIRYSGFAILFNTFFLVISTIISMVEGDESFLPLFYTCLLSLFLGLSPILLIPPVGDLSNKEGMSVVVLTWLLSCLLGMIPYYLYGGEFTFTNAWFESVSGYTTTGSSILTDIEALPSGLIFWRGATHWIGGVGIIVFMLAILPSLGVSGMVLYRSETSRYTMNKLRFTTRRAIQVLVRVYVGLTLLETLALRLAGMSWLDAVIHSFATIATGGFSSKNSSIAFYNSVSIEVIIIVFMVLSGIHFGLLFSAIKGNIQELFRSSALKYYLGAILIAIVIGTVFLRLHNYPTWGESLRYAAFQLISIGTSTGFANVDDTIWPPVVQLIILYLTFQCACAGSTSGGIKVDRFVIFFKTLIRRVKLIENPNAVIPLIIDRERQDLSFAEMALLYIILYFVVVFIASILLTMMGVDALTAFSGSAATMGNVGPGLGEVGSFGNYASIPAAGKWILTITMLLGRLEIYSFVVIFMKRFWK